MSGSEEQSDFLCLQERMDYPIARILRSAKVTVGPMLLRDFGDQLFFSKDSGSHKKSNIKMILDSFPHLPFVLIVTVANEDPETYTDVVKEYSTRIRVVCIRSINKHPSRLAAIDKLIDEVRHLGTQLVLTPDSEFSAAHAAAEGLMLPPKLPPFVPRKKRSGCTKAGGDTPTECFVKVSIDRIVYRLNRPDARCANPLL